MFQKNLTKARQCFIMTQLLIFAEVAESADAQDSKSCEGNFMRVQVPPSAPVQQTRWGLFFCEILAEATRH